MSEQVLPRTPAGVPFAAGLRDHDDRVALVDGRGTTTYAELADRVDAFLDVLDDGGGARRLVVVEASATVEGITAYLAALAGGHPVALTTDAATLEAYDPDVVVTRAGEVRQRRQRTAHDLHPDLALLLSTSGSTGSPKLVRLSHRNLQANAEAIAAFLELDAGDRAVTSLPLHYCYGLSVLHSHLARGAGVVLSDRSVVEPTFWGECRAAAATSIAGVPHTFELLDRAGFDGTWLPSLRRLTQAGGRMDPERVRRYAELGRRHGWDLYVMYGQTEATARMAYLPPALAAEHPSTIGVAVPGGTLRIDPGVAEPPGVGELVYRGDNVMLGYATGPADLALGRTVDELRTGDLARRTPEGLVEIVGRRSRFLKLFGLRVDLEQVERLLEEHEVRASCAGDDRLLVVATTTAGRADEVNRVVASHVGLPSWAVAVVEIDELPRLPNGKPDHAAVAALAAAPASAGDRPSVAALYAEVLGLDAVGENDTFVGLGGDSLSYVEVSIRLEQVLGHLPPSWHETPVGDLEPSARTSRVSRTASVETNVVLRALAIVLVVAGHTDLLDLAGGAHVLLAVAGFNYARFQLRSGRGSASIARIAVPSVLWIGGVLALTDRLAPANLVLLHGYLGPSTGSGLWGYWFIEAIVQLLLVLALLGSVPAVRRFERLRPHAAALAVTALGLALRFDVLPLADGPRPRYIAHNVLWLFALGWLAERADSAPRRLVVSAIAAASVPGFFGDPQREAIVLGGVLLLTWARTVPLPTGASRLVGAVAGASLYVYLTHWQVHDPLLDAAGPLVATIGSVAAGVAAWRLAERARYGWSRLARRASTTSAPAPMSSA